MIKRLFLITILIVTAATLFGCGGSGNSTLNAPVGVNAGVASRVELMATSYVNQTNSYCYFKAKVTDGNGTPIENMEVIFTNLSITGVLDQTTAVTGTNGIATVTLYSTISGFATVQAEVDAGTEKIVDKKTVFFSVFDLTVPGVNTNFATLILDVDSNNNGIYDEPSDYILLSPPDKTDAIIRATVTDTTGAPLLNSAVTFGADSPEVSFPLGSSPTAPVVHTNAAGQASVLARVSPTILRTTETMVNITAAADNGTFNVLTLFLMPVTVNTVTVTANPSIVPSAGTSAISATVVTTAGTPVPANTVVNFTTSAGAITPFAPTDATGVAIATFTAPTVTTLQNATVTASVGGVTGSTIVTVTPASVALSAIPTTQIMPLPIVVGQTAKYTIIGGTAPYTVFSDNPAVAKGSITGSTLTATIVSVPAAATVVTFSIYDAAGATVNVTLKLNIVGGGGAGTMLIQPSSATVVGNPANHLTFDITGGTTPFNCISSNTAIIASPGIVNNLASSFTVAPNSVLASTVVTVTCTDANNLVASTVITVTPTPFSITINPTIVIGLGASSTLDPVTVTIIGGTGPYIVTSSNPALTPNGTWSFPATPFSFVIYPNNVGVTTSVTLTVVDNTAATASATLTIFPQTAGLVISINKPDVIGLPNPDSNSSDDETMTVTGGVAPYTISAGSAGTNCNNAFFAPIGPWFIPASGGTFIIDPNAPGASSCTTTLTVTDHIGAIATTTFNVHP